MTLLLELTVVFAIAAFVLFLSAKLKVPTIVGLLLSGFVAGPYGLGLVNATEEVEVMAEIGILLLLFTIGMEFSLKKLAETKKWILLGGGLQVFLTVAAVFGLGQAMGWTVEQSLFIGFLFSMSSTAIVLHILQEKGKMDKPHGKASLSILIFQDIIIIPMMLIVPLLAGQGEGSGTEALLWKLTKGGLIITAVVLLARYLVPRLLREIVHTRNQELFLMSILVICFATAFTTHQLGLKLALGAFLAGLIISESEYSYDALSHILPLKKIFTGIFFISVGMLLNTWFLVDHLLLLLSLTGSVLLLKALLILIIGTAMGLSLTSALIVGLSLCQVGEFAFVLSKTGSEFNLL
ncbi:MAG: cation:proton antiporter, partial [Saprospiraceae bacterium]|nr:cation:proton antiporter [Saprospiraceae bacterium]